MEISLVCNPSFLCPPPHVLTFAVDLVIGRNRNTSTQRVLKALGFWQTEPGSCFN
jgi:hypothetical protein